LAQNATWVVFVPEERIPIREPSQAEATRFVPEEQRGTIPAGGEDFTSPQQAEPAACREREEGLNIPIFQQIDILHRGPTGSIGQKQKKARGSIDLAAPRLIVARKF